VLQSIAKSIALWRAVTVSRGLSVIILKAAHF
jgi:hypothetical protein